MKNRLSKIVTATALLLTTSTALADWSYYTGATQQRQDTEQWCWASATRAVLKHNKNVDRDQCRLASQYIAGKGYTDYCCTGPVSVWGRPTPIASRKAECVQPHSVSDTLGEFGAYERYVSHPAGPDGVSGVETQLAENTPPIAVIAWASGGQHAITIVSAVNAANQTKYEIYDPWEGRTWIARSNLKVYRTTGKWTGTVHTK